jgi:uncharacterized membrane protein
LFAIYTLAHWQLIDEWSNRYLILHNKSEITHAPTAFIIILCLTSFITLGFFGLSKLEKLKFLATPLNLLLIFSQTLDGIATFIGVDFYGYREKHVIPTYLISLCGTAIIILIFKLIMVFLVIYLIDMKKYLARYESVDVLGKGLLILVGLAPGIRDMLRISMGI